MNYTSPIYKSITHELTREWARIAAPTGDLAARAGELLEKWREVYGALAEGAAKHANIRGLTDRGNIHSDELIDGKLVRFVFSWEMAKEYHAALDADRPWGGDRLDQTDVDNALASGDATCVVCFGCTNWKGSR